MLHSGVPVNVVEGIARKCPLGQAGLVVVCIGISDFTIADLPDVAETDSKCETAAW